ncbi:MAG: hypothetical protein SGI88_14045 [Candidatus Hydrogenedentes bacterium]|nr:hypothetical protein [Candidatus Hydrogenedentota bacterium]
MKKLALFASVIMFGALAASAGTMGVAAFSDGAGGTNSQLFPTTGQFAATFLTLHNNTNATNVYTILYFANDGTARGGAQTFAIPANAARGWRPVATDANEGVGSSIPNASGAAGAGSATILFTDAVPPSGAVRVFVGGAAGSNAAYGFAMVP